MVSEEKSDDDQIEVGSEEERPTILLVDDNKEMVDYLKDNFRQNYVTLTAGNGERSIGYYERAPCGYCPFRRDDAGY